MMMADTSSDVRERLKNQGFRNWVSLVLMLDKVKDALQKVALKVLSDFWKRRKRQFKSRTLCGKCSFRSRECAKPSNCPGADIKKAILGLCRYEEPMFQNTTMQKCLNDPWAVAKCYMPGQYSRKPCSETDFSGFINLIINNILFTNNMNEGYTLEKKMDILKKAREVRNFIMHVSPLEISGSCLKDNMKALVKMLECFGEIIDSSYIDSIEKLEHDAFSEYDVVAACKLKLSALNEYEQECTEMLPRWKRELEKMILKYDDIKRSTQAELKPLGSEDKTDTAIRRENTV